MTVQLPAQRLARPGVWAFTDSLTAAESVDLARRVEDAGFSVLWLPEFAGRDPFAHAALLAARTQSLVLATGIANVYHRLPGVMVQGARTVSELSDGRFLLGLGVSHARTVEGLRGLSYTRPLSYMRDYLADMRAAPYTAPALPTPVPTVLGALGVKMTQLGATSADGVHPYSTDPRHTARTRELVGPDKLICVEQKVVLTDDLEAGLETARRALARIVDLPNYRRCWLSLGYTEAEIDARAASFVGGIVSVGPAEVIAARVRAHYDAGATHVCLNPLGPSGSGAPSVADLETLAAVLIT